MRELWGGLSKLEKVIIETGVKQKFDNSIRFGAAPENVAVQLMAYIDQTYHDPEQNSYADFCLRHHIATLTREGAEWQDQ